MFRRHKKSKPDETKTYDEIIDFIAGLEPKQMDRLVALAKERRTYLQKVSSFLNNGPAKLERVEEELELLEIGG